MVKSNVLICDFNEYGKCYYYIINLYEYNKLVKNRIWKLKYSNYGAFRFKNKKIYLSDRW